MYRGIKKFVVEETLTYSKEIWARKILLIAKAFRAIFCDRNLTGVSSKRTLNDNILKKDWCSTQTSHRMYSISFFSPSTSIFSLLSSYFFPILSLSLFRSIYYSISLVLTQPLRVLLSIIFKLSLTFFSLAMVHFNYINPIYSFEILVFLVNGSL